MGVNFKIAMALEAVNRMDGGIRGAINSVNKLKSTIIRNAKETSSVNPVTGWSEKINKVTNSAKLLKKELSSVGKSYSESGEKMQNNGLRNMAEGAGLLAPVISMANKAGQLQTKMTSMQMSGISKQGTEELMNRADKYTEQTVFGKTEIADMFLSMRQSGMKEASILRGSEPMVFLAELESIRRGTMGTETAKVLAQMAERGGILQDPNIERWNDFLELVNRVTTVTTAGIPELHESSKYLEPVARAAGWSEQDMMWSQGIAARFGLEGSVAGTDLKDMIARLNPLKWYKEGRPDQHLDAMDRLGWLQGVESHRTKAGRTAYDGIGGSVMLAKDGSTVNMMEMFGQFAKSWERYKTMPQGRAKFAADMFKVLGEQGEKTALLVSQNYDVITQMMEDADKVKSIHEQIDAHRQYTQNYKAFKSAIETLQIDAGNTFLSGGTEFIQNTLRPWIKEIRDFTKAHPSFVSAVAQGIAVIAGLKLGIGAFRIVAGTLMTTFGGITSGAGMLVGWIGKLGHGLGNLKAGYDLLRGTGAGRFMSLIQGAQLAFPWLGKLTGGFGRLISSYKSGRLAGLGFGKSLAQGMITAFPLFGRIKTAVGGIGTKFKSVTGKIKAFSQIGSGLGKAIGRDALIGIKAISKLGKSAAGFTAKWLVHAGRIAAGWLIAMGPPGWIIMGVTALVIAGVAAWKTNFMGFRDKCISCWNDISAWGSKTWGDICGFIATAMDRASGFIEQVKRALGMASELDQKQHTWGPIRGLELSTPDIPYLNPDAGNSNTNTITSNYTFNTNSADDTVSIAGRMGANEYFGADGNPAANGNYF